MVTHSILGYSTIAYLIRCMPRVILTRELQKTPCSHPRMSSLQDALLFILSMYLNSTVKAYLINTGYCFRVTSLFLSNIRIRLQDVGQKSTSIFIKQATVIMLTKLAFDVTMNSSLYNKILTTVCLLKIHLSRFGC